MKRCANCSTPVNIPSKFTEREKGKFLCATCKMYSLIDRTLEPVDTDEETDGK